ncbi:MAG: pseudouridine synthase [Betaproteobacteria bacterium]
MQKVLAAAGVASRRASEALIRAGRVSVNGQVITELGVRVDPARDEVAVDGRPLKPRVRPTYVMLNKPAGVITTARDPQGRPTVLDLVKGVKARLFPVGRLDADTEGLLLLTNDGELAHRLLHPRFHIPKTYVAEVRGKIPESALVRLADGVELEDGRTLPADVHLIWCGPERSVVQVTLREGRKRQVKRMFSAVGHPVVALRRVAFGPLTLDNLPVGSWRPLTHAEVEALRRACVSGES